MPNTQFFDSLFSVRIDLYRRQPGADWIVEAFVYYKSEPVDQAGWHGRKAEPLLWQALAFYYSVKARYTQGDLPGSFKVEGTDDYQLPLSDALLNPDEP